MFGARHEIANSRIPNALQRELIDIRRAAGEGDGGGEVGAELGVHDILRRLFLLDRLGDEILAR